MIYDIWSITTSDRDLLGAFLLREKNDAIHLMWRHLEENEGITDFDLMIKIFGKADSKNYRILKGKFEHTLLKCLIVQNTSDERTPKRVLNYFEVQRNILAANILLNKKKRNAAINILESVIDISLKYHMTEFVILASRQLAWHYGITSYNKYKFNLYSNILNNSIEIQSKELLAEQFSRELQTRNARLASNPSQEDKLMAKNYSNILNSFTHIHSFTFLYNKYLVNAIQFEYSEDFKGLLSLSEAAIEQFESPDLKANFVLDAINIRKIYALIRLDNFIEADKVGWNILINSYSTYIFWFRVAYYIIKVRIYLKDYNGALNLLIDVFNQKYFKKLPLAYQELFETKLGYMHLLIRSKLIETEKKYIEILPSFKIAKFLNNIPVYSKDKRGINISILLLHIAFLLQKGDFESVAEKIHSLQSYSGRYLKHNDSFRSNCMIKMVIQMTKADFNPIRTARYTADLRKQLGHVTLAGSGENIEVEIIPFEVLWDIMMKAL